jgi:hypothetical protein
MALEALPRLRGGTSAARQQLPFWGDAASWDQPQYYQTFEASRRPQRNGGVSNIFPDNRDTLLIRGPGGLLINHYDSVTGQWMQVPNAPVLSDAAGWADPAYYSTIMMADIDGDGIAELLARDSTGIKVWKYDSTAAQWNQMPDGPATSDAAGWHNPQYYSTLQCADIDDDGAFELIGRGEDALYVWKYDPSSQTWPQLAELPDLSDANGWNQPQYYSTIQCRDINLIHQPIIIARGANGLQGWAYGNGGFAPVPANPAWSDANGWNQPQYYSTIQIAATGLGPTIGDAPGQTIMGRGPNGIEAWYLSTEPDWQQIPFTPLLTDAQGWDKPEYYSTIQFVDIDGDGVVEMVARGPQGLQAWKLQQNNDGSYSWVPLPNGPGWSDAAGWNQVQYYSTVQSAWDGTQGLIVARNSRFVETWGYDATAQAWSQTSNAAFPSFIGDQLTAYNYLTNQWNILGTNGGGVRYVYNDQSADFSRWRDELQFNQIPAPGNVSADDWNAVSTQIMNELTWVINVQKWYGTGGLVNTQITDTFLGEQLTLYTVGPYLSFSNDNTATLALSIIALIAGALAAVLGFPELEAGVAASIVGVIGYAFSAAEVALPGQGGSFQAQYDQLQAVLADGFNAALTQLGNNLFAITGGRDSSGYVPGDYGLLSAIGQMIETTVWNWPVNSTNLVAQMQRGYAIEVWKVLFNTYQAIAGSNTWGIGVNTYATTYVPYNYPTSNAIWNGPATNQNGDPVYCNHWLYIGGLTSLTYPPAGTLTAQFDPPVDGQVFPLGIPAAEVFQGQNGWPLMNTEDMA